MSNQFVVTGASEDYVAARSKLLGAGASVKLSDPFTEDKP
jgi:hypothetical protein